MFTKRLLLVSGGVALIAVAGTVTAVAIATARAPQPGVLAPAPRMHSMPAALRSHTGAASYVSAAVAERSALEIASHLGSGALVLRARLMSVAAASKATGDRVGSYHTSNSSEIWLVWIRGPWRVLNCITATACPVKPNQIYYAVIDAKTGVEDGVGWSQAYQHGATTLGR